MTNDFNKITDLMEKVDNLEKENKFLKDKVNNSLQVIKDAGMDDYKIICLVEDILKDYNREH